MMVVVSYDVTQDESRSRLAKLVLDYGKRVQKSVYECHIDDGELVELQERVAQIIDMSRDSVRYYTICKKCYFAIEMQGLGSITEDDDDTLVI